MDFVYPGDESIVLRDADVSGTGTSFADDKDRWSEATVVLTDAGNYFVAVVGRSRLPNETDRHWAMFHEEPEELIRALCRRWRNHRGLPPYLHRALSEAAADDDRLNDALDEYERWQ